MAVTERTRELQQQLKAEISALVDETTRNLVQAWGRAWNEIVAEWQAAFSALIATSADGAWPSRFVVERAERAAVALRMTATKLTELSQLAGVTITNTIPGLVSLVDEWERKAGMSQLVDGMNIIWTRVDDRAVEGIVRRVSGQVESLLWPLPAEQQAVMKSTLIRGVLVGDNPRAVASTMLSRVATGFGIAKPGGVFTGGLARALNIARTEMLDASRLASRESRTANRDILKGWMWTCEKSSRTCPSCLALDGTVYDLDVPGPDDHQSGRCIATPLTKSWADLGFSDIPEPDADYQTGREWFDEQDADTQQRIMGSSRLDAYKSGQIGWDDMTTVRSNPGWRDSHVTAPLNTNR